MKFSRYKNANDCVPVMVVGFLGKHLLLSQQQVREGACSPRWSAGRRKVANLGRSHIHVYDVGFIVRDSFPC